jgi:hypothetical protein
VLNCDVCLGDSHGPWGGRVGGAGQGAISEKGSNWRLEGGFNALLTIPYLKLRTTRLALRWMKEPIAVVGFLVSAVGLEPTTP